MWRWYFVAVACVIHFGTVTRSSSIGAENVRLPHQLGVTECCPCDPGARSAWPNEGKAVDPGGDVRARMLDDCPCRGRAADADGASSILFPNAVSAVRPFLRSDGPKKDLKPLLHPEVDLASSVLSTLKEVTEEDYREALARDAARNAARTLERDAVPEESRNIVTIVVDPNSESNEDKFLAQASHNEDMRCIHPFDMSRSSLKSFKKTPNMLNNLSLRNANPVSTAAKLLDRDSSAKASNIQEQKSYIPTFKAGSILNKLFGKNQVKGKEDDLKKKVEDGFNEKRSGPLAQTNEFNIDSSASASNIENKMSENVEKLEDKNHFSEIISRPIKNLLKLRDVELIPKNVLAERKLAKPQELIPPLDFDNLKHKLSQFRLPNLIHKLKRREPIDLNHGNLKPSIIEDSGLAASSINEQIIGTNQNDKLESQTFNPLFLRFNEKSSNKIDGKTNGNIALIDNKLISKIPDLRLPSKEDMSKLKESIRTRLATIPNLLKPRNNGQEDSEPAGSANIISKHVIPKEKSDIVKKLRELREKSRNALPNILQNQIKSYVTPKNSDISKIPESKRSENCELDTREYKEIKNANRTPLETNILDAITSPSAEKSNIIDESGALPEIQSGKNFVSLSEKSRNVVPNILQNKIKSYVTPNKSDISKILESKGSENCELETTREHQEMQNTNKTPLETNILDAVPSPSVEHSNIIDESDVLPEIQTGKDFVPMSENETKPELSMTSPDLNEEEVSSIESQENDDGEKASVDSNENIDFDNTEDVTTNESNSLNKLVLFEQNMKKSEKDSLELPNRVLGKNELKNLIDESKHNIRILQKPVIRFAPVKEGKENDESFFTTKLVQKSEDEQKKSADNEHRDGKFGTRNRELENSEIFAEKEINNFQNENKSSVNEDDPSFAVRDSSSSSTNERPVTLEELQEMSDSLLEQSRQKAQFSESSEESNISKTETKEEGISALPENNLSSSETPSVEKVSSDRSASVPNFDDNIEEDKNNIENTCSSDFTNEKKNDNDVTPDASENIFNTLASPLRQNLIVEPTSLVHGLRNSLNLLKPEVEDVLNLNTKLPTLDEIHLGLKNALNPLTRSSGLFSNRNLDLIPETSERRIKSTVPSSFSAEPLEVDVFQMNPLSSSRSNNLLPINLPRINLDTFKTRFAMPDSLGLKPLMLESAVGDKRGMVGTSLTFRPDKKNLRDSKSLSLVDKLRETPNLIKPIREIPPLEELRNRMRERVESLLRGGADSFSPLGSSSIGSLSDSLKSKAENTFNNLHNTLAGTLRRAHETGSNILGNAYAKPNNLFEEISQRHEDLTDKLKGIHYDLNDRLTSLHDAIKEKSILPEFDLIQPKEIEDSRQSIKNMRKQPSVTSKTVNTRKNKAPPMSRSNSERVKSSRLKMLPSASVPVPKSIEAPKLTKSQSVSAVNPLPRMVKPEIQRQQIVSEKAQQREKLDQPLFEQNTKNMLLKHKQPKKSSTTSKPMLRLANNRITASPKNPIFNNLLDNQDIKEAPTEKVSSRIHSFPTNLKNIRPESKSSLVSSIPKKPTLAALKTPAELRKAFTLPNLSWPKNTENSFLNKVREALKVRMDSAKAKANSSNKGAGKILDAKDMERSASTNLGEVKSLPEPIRENAPYKCKMICTRDSTETN